MNKDILNILALKAKRKKVNEIHVYPPSKLNEGSNKTDCIAIPGENSSDDNKVGFNTARQDTIRGNNIFEFTILYSDWDVVNIANGGIIDVSGLDRILVTSFTYTMTYRMGTEASSPTFALGVKVTNTGGVLEQDQGLVDNGCDNTDDTRSGKIGDIADSRVGASLEAYLEHGTVTQACADPPKSVSATASGIIVADSAVLGSFNSNKVSISLG